jgi:pimeloyl-ACP methyl ester carboxylesterase
MSRVSRRLLLAALLGITLAPPLSAERQILDIEAEVGGRAIHALCTEGPRQAILLHGESGGAESWRPVLERLAGRVGACAYDRAGPASETAPARGWFELMDELRSVHVALGVTPGYTLVGHSIGGLYARLLAADRPLDVGGLVLVDPTHEDMPEAASPGMPREAWSEWMSQRQTPNRDGVREVDLARQARSSRLPDIPVTVITATVRKDGDGWDARFLSEAARRAHAAVLHGVRAGRHIPASGSGPEVPLEAPELVAAEISRMVHMTAARDR